MEKEKRGGEIKNQITHLCIFINFESRIPSGPLHLDLNIWVSEVEIEKKKFSDLLIRGDTIVYISPYTP